MIRYIITIAITLFLSVPVILSAQNPPHPNGGSGPGGGAPIDGGIGILVALGTFYGLKKSKTVSFRNKV